MPDKDFVCVFKQLQCWDAEVAIRCKYVSTQLKRLTSTVRVQMQESLAGQFAAKVTVAASQTLNHRPQRHLANAPFQEKLRKSWTISIRHHV